MSFFSAIRVALAALLVNKGRSTLTSLGIVIGISAVIALVSAGDGARILLDERLDTVGKNLIIVRAGARTQQGVVTDFTPLTHEDADVIEKDVGPLLLAVAKLQLHQAGAQAGGHVWKTSFVGCTPELAKVRKWTLVTGEFFRDEDVKRMATVCLIGQTVRKKLFPDMPNPVGQKLRTGNINLTILGVLSEKGKSPLGADQDDQVFMPLSTMEQYITGNKNLVMILTAPKSDSVGDRARAEITRVLREQHRLKPGDENFDVQSVREMAQLATVITKTLHVLIAVIASISLVVGGIGIMNIMLVSVTERTREIGIRMAVGATPADVLIQFLIEAIVLALVGGIIGITLGIAAALGMAKLIGWPPVISPSIILLTFGVAGGVGVFFGYYPALKASRLDPIDALRYE